MKNLACSALTLVILFFSSQAFSKPNDVKILKFTMKEIEICYSEEQCEDVDRKSLPDPAKETLLVENFDKPTGMVMFKHNGKEMWVHQSEVDLNVKAVASVICTGEVATTTQGQDISSSKKSKYATFGLGEGCK